MCSLELGRHFSQLRAKVTLRHTEAFLRRPQPCFVCRIYHENDPVGFVVVLRVRSTPICQVATVQILVAHALQPLRAALGVPCGESTAASDLRRAIPHSAPDPSSKVRRVLDIAKPGVGRVAVQQ